jgi:hypothetical protein
MLNDVGKQTKSSFNNLHNLPETVLEDAPTNEVILKGMDEMIDDNYLEGSDLNDAYKKAKSANEIKMPKGPKEDQS